MSYAMTFPATRYASALTVSSRASSETSRFISQKSEEGLRLLKSSLTFGCLGKKTDDELWLQFMECREANWDGHGAEPVAEETYQFAAQFLKALPLGAPNPGLGAEADGHLTMEWYRSPHRTLSASISPEGELHYAALIGGSKAYGTEPFFGEIPEAIMNLIHRVMAR